MLTHSDKSIRLPDQGEIIEYTAQKKILRFFDGYIKHNNLYRVVFGIIMLFEISIFKQQIQRLSSMKNRYFSPDLRVQPLLSKEKKQSKLRWAGSNPKLYLPHNSNEDDIQVRVGNYIYYRNKELGSGYSSKVYKGKKQGSLTAYAIKVIDLKNYRSSNLEMLENQIEILKSVDHPNILKCYDIIKTRQKCYIITEYCPNGDLLAYLSKKGKIPEKDARQIIAQIINGCKYLIQNGIIHRDIKPANIIRSADTWKIADFGFAIRSNKQIRTKYNVGTPLYMPLQSLIENLYSAKSDIFAIGIILFELIIGRTPWQSKTEKDLINKMKNSPFRIPNKVKISTDTKAILEKFCNPQQQERIQKNEFLSLGIGQEPSENPQHFNECRNINFSKKGIAKRIQHKSLDLNSEQFPFQKSSIKVEQNISLQPSQMIQNIHNQLKYTSNQVSQQYFLNHKKPTRCKIQKMYSRKFLNLNSGNHIRQQQTSKNTSYSYSHRNIIINQLHFCRFQYYIIRNIQYLLISDKKRQKLCLVIFKHILKSIKILNHKCDSQRVSHASQQNTKILSEDNIANIIKEYMTRYEKEYCIFTKNIAIETLREVHRQFPEFNVGDPFGIQFYGKILKFLAPIIRLDNHQVGLYIIRKQNCSQILDNSEICLIEALKSLLKLYRLIETNINHFEDLEHFESHSFIKVLPDYTKSLCDAESYIKLRKQIKNI